MTMNETNKRKETNYLCQLRRFWSAEMRAKFKNVNSHNFQKRQKTGERIPVSYTVESAEQEYAQEIKS